MNPRIALVDYEMGNLRSVSKALEKVGGEVEWVQDPTSLKFFDALVLPGVGAFFVAVKNLKKLKLFDSIRAWISCKKPFLGICLGYQLLFEESEESHNKEKGLGIFLGKVQKFPNKRNLKIPHIGWNQIYKHQPSHIFQAVPDGSYFYFVHSYFPVPKDKKIIASTTCHGIEFSSSICKENLFACQFHPEKSGRLGIELLKNFVNAI